MRTVSLHSASPQHNHLARSPSAAPNTEEDPPGSRGWTSGEVIPGAAAILTGAALPSHLEPKHHNTGHENPSNTAESFDSLEMVYQTHPYRGLTTKKSQRHLFHVSGRDVWGHVTSSMTSGNVMTGQRRKRNILKSL